MNATFGRALRGATIAALLAAAACSRVAPAPDGARHPWTIAGHLRIGSTDEPDNLNPMFAHTDATDQIDALLFAPVLRYDARGEFLPELVTEVPTYANGGISRDSKTIVFHWRRNVRWSDGAPLTARDLRFTWRAVADKRNNVKTTFGWDDVAAIDAPDPLTAIVRLRRPNADVLGIFAVGGSAYPPLPEHVLSGVPDLNRAGFNAHPLASGPWMLAKWNHGSSLEFVPNPRYWRGAPRLAALSFRIVPNPDTLVAQLATHELDLVPTVPPPDVARLATISGLLVAAHRTANFRRLAINCSRPGLRDVRVRRAIAEAIDWNRIDATIYHGRNVRATSDIPPDSWAAPRIPAHPHDPAGARRLLAAAGYARKPLRLWISATTKPENEQAEVQMQQDLAAAGIDLSVKNYPASFLFAMDGPLYGGRYDLEWSIDTSGPDPDNQAAWSADFIPPHGANTTFLRDPVLTRTSDAALRTFDRTKRKALYQIEEERIHALVPTVFFFWETQVAAYNSDLKGYEPAEYITDNWNSWQWTI
jgi:peptide/nickel transport system substrate-binding protein